MLSPFGEGGEYHIVLGGSVAWKVWAALTILLFRYRLSISFKLILNERTLFTYKVSTSGNKSQNYLWKLDCYLKISLEESREHMMSSFLQR